MKKTGFEWSALPYEVKQLILLCLPLPDVFRLRAVDRSWNALLSSNAFLQLWSSSAPAHHSYWLKQAVAPAPAPAPAPSDPPAGDGALVHPDHGVRPCCGRPALQQPTVLCLCSRTRRDFALPLPHTRFRPQMLPEALDLGLRGAGSDRPPCFSIFAASGGSLIAELAFYCRTKSHRWEPSVCVRVSTYTTSTAVPAIRVLNVVTGLCRQLSLPLASICTVSPSTSVLIPGFQDRAYTSTHCLLEPRTRKGSYRGKYDLRLLVSDDGMYYHLVIQIPAKAVMLLVYDSRCPGSWRVVHGMQCEHSGNEDESVWELSQAAFQGHDIYESDLFFPVVSKGLILGYRVETDEWSKVSVTSEFPDKECVIHHPAVMKFKGPRILMAVPLCNCFDSRRIFDGFSLWELQKCSLQSSNPCSQAQSYFWTEVARTPEYLSSEYHYIDALHFVHGNGMICITGTCYDVSQSSSSDGDALIKRCVSSPVYDLVQGRWFLMPCDWINSRAEPLILSSIQPSFPGAVP